MVSLSVPSSSFQDASGPFPITTQPSTRRVTSTSSTSAAVISSSESSDSILSLSPPKGNVLRSKGASSRSALPHPESTPTPTATAASMATPRPRC